MLSTVPPAASSPGPVSSAPESMFFFNSLEFTSFSSDLSSQAIRASGVHGPFNVIIGHPAAEEPDTPKSGSMAVSSPMASATGSHRFPGLENGAHSHRRGSWTPLCTFS